MHNKFKISGRSEDNIRRWVLSWLLREKTLMDFIKENFKKTIKSMKTGK